MRPGPARSVMRGMMPDGDWLIDADTAAATLMRLLAVEGTTGHEDGIAREVIACLSEAGVPGNRIHHDDAHTRIPVPTPVGNLFVDVPGTRPGPRRLFVSHL